MTLESCGRKIAELEKQIAILQTDRENALKEWNTLFNAENHEGIACIDEVYENTHTLYLVNHESRMNICMFTDDELKDYETVKFYRFIDVMIQIKNIAEKREVELPEWQKNLVYSKIAEIRQAYFEGQKKQKANN